MAEGGGERGCAGEMLGEREQNKEREGQWVGRGLEAEERTGREDQRRGWSVSDNRPTLPASSAIKDMHVRGAGLIGAAAGYGMFLAALKAPKSSPEEHLKFLQEAGSFLK
eukprot:745784-Hanusia_phi.AAC.1